MATKYLHAGLATGANDGSSAANAWQSIHDALSGVTAGDEILSYDGGSGETLSVKPTASVAGTNVNKIKFVSTNASFVDDGTRYVLDGNSAVANCIDMAGYDYYGFKGFDLTGATSDGYTTTATTNMEMVACRFYNNGRYGYYLAGAGHVFSRCEFYNNTNNGLHSISGTAYFEFCKAYSNGGTFGFYCAGSSVLYRCIVFDETYGFRTNTTDFLSNCIADDCTNGIYSNNTSTLINNIFSNCGVGITGGTAYPINGVNNAFYNNTTDVDAALTKYNDVTPRVAIGADPYNSQATRDYTITDSTLIGIARDLDGTNISYESYGMLTEYASGGGGRIPRMRIHNV